MVDVADQVDAVDRRVAREVVGGREQHVLSLAQVLPVGADELWPALTRRERIARWFLPVTGDLRAGGRYQLEGNAGGTVESCDPPHGFAATWEFEGVVGRIAVRVESLAGDRARLTLEHRCDADDATWADYGPGATGVGWDLSLLGLALHLAPGGADDPADAATWAGEEDGERFIQLSGEAWYAADVVGGAGWAEARMRADRTIAAYTAPVDDEG